MSASSQALSRAQSRSLARTQGSKSRQQKRSHDDWLTEMETIEPDGRSCKLCCGRDTDPDPCGLTKRRIWGHNAKDSQGVRRNTGTICYLCLRVFQARWHPKYNVKQMPAVLGQDQAEYNRFHGFVKVLTKSIQERNTIYFQLDWNQQETLLHISEDNTIWEDPVDLFIPMADYVAKHGHPSTNGTGHQIGRNRRGQDPAGTKTPRPLRVSAGF